MSQNLRTLMSLAKAKITTEKAKAEAKPKEPTYHQLQSRAYQLDPSNQDYQSAVGIGKLKAKVFMKAVLDTSDPSHEDAFNRFKHIYDMDPAKAEADFVDKECNESNAHPYEFFDGSYEQALLRKYKPQGDIKSQDLAFYDNFCKAMQNKWDKVGYKEDKAFVQAYADKYGLKPAVNGSQYLEEKD